MADSRSLSERLAKMPPGRHLVPRDFVTQNQRERMLLATTELVAERGYQKTTIELVAKTARVALSTFYEHFANKEECFLAALDESVAGAAAVFEELLDSEQPWPDQIATGLEVLLEMVETEPSRARLCIVESQAAGGAALARYQAMLEDVAPKLREGRQFNPRASRLPDGLEIAIAGGLAWLVHQRLVSDRTDGIRALLPEMLQVTLTPYIGEVEAGRLADAAEARAA
ncbi:MAG TPA: TetR/AcrR family transcriptional regulator [Solirubrobacterales bacterium]|nr:TetR/AcrR family transcriptional regulator [Solirubrobacterales bacterium]